MKRPRELNLRTGHYSSLSIAHLDDTGKCYLGTSSYGEHTSTSLTKTEAKRIAKWLTMWVKFKESSSKSRGTKK